MQSGGQMVELIDLDCRNASFHWTSANNRILATLSGSLVSYLPFPGGVPQGIEESSDLGVSVIDFVMANTGAVFSAIMAGGDFAAASLRVSRVFADTPDLDRMYIYIGNIGDYSYDRDTVTGQARNRWKSIGIQWPYYTYQDRCAWRFGSTGCGFDTSSVTTAVATNQVLPISDTLNIYVNTGIISNSYASGRFDFGRLTVKTGANSGQVRTIRAHTGDLLSLSYPLSVNSMTGLSFDIFPGCRKRLIDDCTSLYDNVENFLGFPWIPIQEQAF